MRAKIAKKLRRDALREGAVIVREGMVFNKQEMRKYNFPRKSNGYSVTAEYNDFKLHACGDDILDAYRNLLWMMDDEYEFFMTNKGKVKTNA